MRVRSSIQAAWPLLPKTFLLFFALGFLLFCPLGVVLPFDQLGITVGLAGFGSGGALRLRCLARGSSAGLLLALRIEPRIDQIIVVLGDSLQIFMIMCSDLRCRFFLRPRMSDLAEIRRSHSRWRELRGILGANLLVAQFRYALLVGLLLSLTHARKFTVTCFCDPP